MFIQIIQGRCHDADRMRQLTEEWHQELGPTAEGWLGGTYGLTDDGEFVAVVRFASREAAAKNSDRPEQGEWWQRMSDCFDGEVTFHDSDNAMLFLDGGSDDAGFVQIIQGRIDDPERFRHFMEQPMDALHEARPEIIGGTIAIEPDGWFTQTICFRTEQEAREGEHKEMPAEIREQFEEEMSHVQDMKYLDLHHPWFASSDG
ncbi:MAG: hypothetical protein JWR85_2440 [Marmoricola sp.]|nr:hypothetical protein [Marmoricola sp.]